MRQPSLIWLFLVTLCLGAGPAEAQVYCLQAGDKSGVQFDPSLVTASLCGDGVCSPGETCGACPCDCCPGAGVLVSTSSGHLTTEAGGTATFTLRLSSQPTASVTVGLSSSDLSEGTVVPSSVTFTVGNWSNAQTVTITGVDDGIADGDVAYTVITADATSTDPTYSGRSVVDVQVTNLDDEPTVGGILVAPTGGLVTSEQGGSATFTMVLGSQPTATVSLGLSSSDPTEGTVAPPSVSFTTSNWSTPQTVTVTGVDDAVDDEAVGFSVVTAAATSGDLTYDGLDAEDVSVTNTDDDVAGFAVAPLEGLITTEPGGSAIFTVVLTSEPTAPVTLELTSSAPTEGTVAPTLLTFTALDWDQGQTVTVTGVDDGTQDGDAPYAVVIAAAASADPRYDGLDPDDVLILNVDDDRPLYAPVASFEVSPGMGAAPLELLLDGQASTADPRTPLALYRWSFKDGSSPGAGAQSSHTYLLPGGYLPELLVVDGAGQEDRTERPVWVSDATGRTPPLARIVATALQGENSLTASFSCDCQLGDGANLSYFWELGTQTATTPEVLDHTFAPGRHSVRLTVVDEYGLSSTASIQVVVTQGGVAPGWCELTLSPPSGAAPLEVEHRALHGAAQGVTLTFFDDTTSQQDTATRAYTQPGRYPVRLEVIDDQGLPCSDLQEVVVVGASGAVPPSVLGSPARAATCAEPYEYQPAVAGSGPFTWTAVAPEGTSLPEGLSIDPATGRVSWLPTGTQSGGWQFRLEAQNAAGADSQLVEVEVGCGERQALAVGCGCGTTPGSAALGLGLLLLGKAWARRRRTPRGSQGNGICRQLQSHSGFVPIRRVRLHWAAESLAGICRVSGFPRP